MNGGPGGGWLIGAEKLIPPPRMAVPAMRPILAASYRSGTSISDTLRRWCEDQMEMVRRPDGECHHNADIEPPVIVNMRYLAPATPNIFTIFESQTVEVQQSGSVRSTATSPSSTGLIRPSLAICINDPYKPACNSFTPRRSRIRRMHAGPLKVAGVESRHACVCHRRNRHHRPRAL
jgi:hypothetical protein